MKKIEIEERFCGKDKEEVQEILDMVFNSISRWIIIENKVNDVEYLTSWEHRSNDLVEKDLGELQIDLVWYQNVIIDRFCLNQFFYFIEGYSFEYIDIHGYIIIK